MRLLSEKDLKAKAFKVVLSCKNEKQLIVAEQYIALVRRQLTAQQTVIRQF